MGTVLEELLPPSDGARSGTNTNRNQRFFVFSETLTATKMLQNRQVEPGGCQPGSGLLDHGVFAARLFEVRAPSALGAANPSTGPTCCCGICTIASSHLDAEPRGMSSRGPLAFAVRRQSQEKPAKRAIGKLRRSISPGGQTAPNRAGFLGCFCTMGTFFQIAPSNPTGGQRLRAAALVLLPRPASSRVRSSAGIINEKEEFSQDLFRSIYAHYP